MNDARAIALELGAIGVTRLGKLPATRFALKVRKGLEQTRFVCFDFLARFKFLQSRSNLSRRFFRAERSCARSVKISKNARRSAVKVNHAQANQKSINHPRCSGGERRGCRKVVPKTSINIATRTTTN